MHAHLCIRLLVWGFYLNSNAVVPVLVLNCDEVAIYESTFLWPISMVTSINASKYPRLCGQVYRIYLAKSPMLTSARDPKDEENGVRYCRTHRTDIVCGCLTNTFPSWRPPKYTLELLVGE